MLRFGSLSTIAIPIPNGNPRIQKSKISKRFSSSSSSTITSSSLNSRVVTHPLSSSSSLKLHRGDITHWSVDGVTDAIVNATNEHMLGGGEIDKAIRKAAGPELHAACYDVPEVCPGVRCPMGDARITRAFKLPVSHVIHTAAPIGDAEFMPGKLLENSYRSCLKLAKENNIQHIAFPSIGCSDFGFIYAEAARIAITMVKEFGSEFKECEMLCLVSASVGGGIIRDIGGRTVMAFAQPLLRISSAYQAEVKAFCLGLKIAVQAGFSSLEIESDCQQMVNKIQQAEIDPGPASMLVAEIKLVFNSILDSSSINYIPRTCNKVADRLAGLGMRCCEGKIWWNDYPPEIQELLVADLAN